MPPKRSIDGIHRSSRPLPKLQPDYRPDHELPAPEPTPMLPKLEIASLPPPKPPKPPKLKKSHGFRKWIFLGLGVLGVALLTAFIVAYGWYMHELSPVSADTTKRVKVTIVSGETPNAIAEELQKDGVIRNQLAFSIYTKLTATENKLRAGTYSLQPSLPTSAIVDHLVAGKVDTFEVTFLPGATLADDRKILLGLGFSQTEVDNGFSQGYGSPLLQGKPSGSDLEGYLYGETIQFDYSATVPTILERFFDQYEQVVADNNLVNDFKKQGLTLYQGITLASIVQRETANPDSQKQVARVFFNRMNAGMPLGSDVTYQYAAKKLGVAPDPKLDSPYNTRIHAGLPPGPIATPGDSALLAVAHPASNDYLYFLAGDDNKMHYATTDEGHQQNIANYCQKRCATP